MADPARILRGDIRSLSAPPSQNPANAFHRAADRPYAGPMPAMCTARDLALPASDPVRRSRPAPARAGPKAVCEGRLPLDLLEPLVAAGYRLETPGPGRGWSSLSTPSTAPTAWSGWAGPTRGRPVRPLRLEPGAPTHPAQISITLPSSAASCSSPPSRASMSWLIWVRISRIGCSSPRWRRSV